jgi:hypothetical protein
LENVPGLSDADGEEGEKMKKITCCNGCVAPKRYPGCHDHCPDYNEARIMEIVSEEAWKQQKRIEDGLKQSKANTVKAALKKSGRKWCE